MGTPLKIQVPHTRLRYVKSKEPEKIIQYLKGLGKRVQIYDMVWAQNAWFLWFVPDDSKSDVTRFGDLDA